jgi:Cellulase (glycosyl hydrolase family 5)
MPKRGRNMRYSCGRDFYISATCGLTYQREVKRVINWIPQAGMDVIFDLHYVSGGTAFDTSGVPTAAHTAFWTSIASDPFFQDGRIIYELYNEPTQDSAGHLRRFNLLELHYQVRGGRHELDPMGLDCGRVGLWLPADHRGLQRDTECDWCTPCKLSSKL